MLIIYKLYKMNFELHFIFMFYFILSLIFFNQFNGIRQYIAVYIIIFSILCIMEKRLLISLILMIIASFFHHSAMYFVVLIPIYKLLNKKISFKFLIILSALFIDLILSKTNYKSYIGSTYYTPLSIRGIITKIPKLLAFYLSFYLIKDYIRSENEIFLLNISIVSVLLLILSFSSSLIWRFYNYI